MTVLQRLGQANASADISSRSRDFCDAIRLLLLAKGDPGNALHFASGSPRRVLDALKTDVPGGTLTSLADVAPYRILSEGFSATLVNSAFDAVLADSNQAPLRSTFAVTVADASAAVVNEGTAKKLTDLSIDRATLDVRKAAVITALSDDVLRFNSAAGLIEAALRNGLANAVDSIFVTGLIAGTTPTGASGTTAAAVLHDIRVMLDATGVSSNSKFHLLIGPGTAARLSVMTTATIGGLSFPQMTPTGGSIAGIQVHPTNAITNTAVLIDASQVVAGADPVAIRISQNASLEMETAPSMSANTGASPPAISAQSTVSMFQTNSSAILVERMFSWTVLRASAVQSLSSVAWAT